MSFIASAAEGAGSAGLWAAAGGIVGLVFLELLKSAITRGRDEATRKVMEERYQAEKLGNCLQKVESLTADRDGWKEKYLQLLDRRDRGTDR